MSGRPASPRDADRQAAGSSAGRRRRGHGVCPSSAGSGASIHTRVRLPFRSRRAERAREQAERDSQRVRPPRTAPVQVQIMGRHSLDVVTARDISATGIGVHVPHGFDAWDLESHIEMVITLPGGPPFLAAGTLRHRSKGGFGVQFTRLADARRDDIRAFVARHGAPRR